MNIFLAVGFLLTVFLVVSEAAIYDREFSEGMKSHWYSEKSWYKAKICEKEKEFFNRLCTNKKLTARMYGGLSVKADLPLPSKRREYRCLSRNERRGFHAAINSMKVNKVTNDSQYSEYDNFIIRHDSQNAPAAHWGPAFLSWHREFILGFERGLQGYCPSCMLPFWDNRLDSRLREYHAGSVLFSDYLGGNVDGPVTTGFPAHWKHVGDFCKTNIGVNIIRDVADRAGTLFSDNDVNYYLVPQYKQIVYPWNSFLEELHGSVHMYFGKKSTMAVTSCSPNDPFFFLHHSFVDLLFENHRNYTKSMRQPLKYPDLKNDIPPSVEDVDNLMLHEAARSKLPFTTRNDEGLYNDDYTKIYYRYERPPGDVEDCQTDRDCCVSVTPDFIWCQRTTGKCVSKLKEGARMDPSFPDNACYCLPPLVPYNSGNVCACR